MAVSISSNASDMAYNILMNGAQFLFTPINKNASEIKEIILEVHFPKQKNQRSTTETHEMLKHVHGSDFELSLIKFLSGIDVSEKEGKVSKMSKALDVRRLPIPMKILKMFLRGYLRADLKQ
ncbi:UNVERIFIED_CONTAM: hypothetical protein NCL1_39141 [Trichonephila clavipes]